MSVKKKMLLEFQGKLTDQIILYSAFNVKKHNTWHHFACNRRDDKPLNNKKVLSGGSVKQRRH